MEAGEKQLEQTLPGLGSPSACAPAVQTGPGADGTVLPELLELDFAALSEALAALGEPKFRAKQLYAWLHQRKASSFDEMTDMPKALRKTLAEQYRLTVMEPVDVLISKLDGTRKYVFELYDGNVIEAVLMRYHHGNSVCISSQVGCRMGCRFCASTLDGCVRNLSAAEMLSEVYRIERDTGERVSNVVIMGSGEPLDNFAEVLRFLRMISDEHGLHISQRNLTLSTCGLVPRMLELAECNLQITLALSLHAPEQATREQLMPIAKVYPLSDVLEACRVYHQKTGRRVSFEYAVVRGVNDNRAEALKLAALLAGMQGHVNLIPVNPIKERAFESPDRSAVLAFQHTLEAAGINATIRREMGRDINSACGQLRRRYIARGTEKPAFRQESSKQELPKQKVPRQEAFQQGASR